MSITKPYQNVCSLDYIPISYKQTYTLNSRGIWNNLYLFALQNAHRQKTNPESDIYTQTLDNPKLKAIFVNNRNNENHMESFCMHAMNII